MAASEVDKRRHSAWGPEGSSEAPRSSHLQDSTRQCYVTPQNGAPQAAVQRGFRKDPHLLNRLTRLAPEVLYRCV